MKKKLAAGLAVAVVAAVGALAIVKWVYPGIKEKRENSLRASEETKQAVEQVLDKLVEQGAAYVSINDIKVDEIEYHLASHSTPERQEFEELEELEEKEDSAVAILERYEEYAEQLKACDMDTLIENAKRDDEDDFEWRYDDPASFRLTVLNMYLDVMLTKQVFFDRLNDAQKARLCKVICDVYNILNEFSEQAYGREAQTYFLNFGGGELLSEYKFVKNDGKLSFKKV